MSETDEMKRRHNFGFLFKEIQHLHKRVNELENNQQKPAEPKRKTIGEICNEGWRNGNTWHGAAKAVAEAIIERHLWHLSEDTRGFTADEIRKEFE